jgi:hypothetical protein
MTASVLTSSLLFYYNWTSSDFTKKETEQRKKTREIKLFKERLGNTFTQFLNQL